MKNDFDYTSMSTYMTCPRKYYYRHERGLVRYDEPLAVLFGKSIHKALDSWWVDKDVSKAVGIFKEDFKERPDEDDKRTHSMGEWIIKNYDSKYRNQPQELVVGEQEFTIRLPNGNNFIGRIDKIVRWDGALWVLDHKTTSQLGASYRKTIEPNLQFTGYIYAARALGYHAVGVIVDAILVAKGLTSAKNSSLTALARFDGYKSEEVIEEWLKTAVSIQGRIRIDSDCDAWTPNWDACTYYGECPYRRICVEDPNIRERVIVSDYKVNHWDPRSEVKK